MSEIELFEQLIGAIHQDQPLKIAVAHQELRNQYPTKRWDYEWMERQMQEYYLKYCVLEMTYDVAVRFPRQKLRQWFADHKYYWNDVKRIGS